MLNVNEVDNASIYQAIENVTAATANDEPEANVFIVAYIFSEPEIYNHCYQQTEANESENPAHALQWAESPAIVTNMGEVNQRV